MQTTFSHTNNQRGVALIMTIFIIALASILVLNFTEETLQYQRTTRGYSERVQANFVIKSGFNFACALLELPKEDGIKEDWLGEPWALISSAQTLPIAGFSGKPRLTIVDESGKININSIVQGGNYIPNPNSNPYLNSSNVLGSDTSSQVGMNFRASQWKEILNNLFTEAGFVREQFAGNENRTLGGIAYPSKDQVAVIHDWLDPDSVAHNSPLFPGQGIESTSNKDWFLNRQAKSLSELIMIPGMTLERMAKIAPFIRVSTQDNSQININTAPAEVLQSLNLQEQEIIDILEKRQLVPFSKSEISTAIPGSDQILPLLTANSNSFSAYIQVQMPNVTRYARAKIKTSNNRINNEGLLTRKAVIEEIELL